VAPLRESNPIKVALLVWVAALLLVRGVPWVQHRYDESTEERASEQALQELYARWRPAASALSAVRLQPSLTACRPTAPLTLEVGFPCWTGPGRVLETAALLRSELGQVGGTQLKPECVQLPGRVWCTLQVTVAGVLLRCDVRPEVGPHGGSFGPSRTDVHVDCFPLHDQHDLGLPKRLPRVPLPATSP
jgi:hypothetical protein